MGRGTELAHLRSVVILNYSPTAPSSHVRLSQSSNHRVEMEKDAVVSLP